MGAGAGNGGVTTSAAELANAAGVATFALAKAAALRLGLSEDLCPPCKEGLWPPREEALAWCTRAEAEEDAPLPLTEAGVLTILPPEVEVVVGGGAARAALTAAGTATDAGASAAVAETATASGTAELGAASEVATGRSAKAPPASTAAIGVAVTAVGAAPGGGTMSAAGAALARSATAAA